MVRARPRAGRWNEPVTALAVPAFLVVPSGLGLAESFIAAAIATAITLGWWYRSGRPLPRPWRAVDAARDTTTGFEFGPPETSTSTRGRVRGFDGVYYPDLDDAENSGRPSWIHDLFGTDRGSPVVPPGDFRRSPGETGDPPDEDDQRHEGDSSIVSARYTPTDDVVEERQTSATVVYETVGERVVEDRDEPSDADADRASARSDAVTVNDGRRSASAEDFADALGASRAVTETVSKRIGQVVNDSSVNAAAAAVSVPCDAPGEVMDRLQAVDADDVLDVRRSIEAMRADERRIEATLGAPDDP